MALFGSFLVLSVLVGLVGGGDWRALAALRLRRTELLVIAVLVQYSLILAAARGYVWAVQYAGVLTVIAYVLLAVAIWYNRHVPGVKIIAAGVFSNFLVIVLNGGAMPVSLEAVRAAGLDALVGRLEAGVFPKHVPLAAQARLWFLADVIPLRPPYYFLRKVVSVGDLIAAAGAFILVQAAMHPRRKFGFRCSRRAGSG